MRIRARFLPPAIVALVAPSTGCIDLLGVDFDHARVVGSGGAGDASTDDAATSPANDASAIDAGDGDDATTPPHDGAAATPPPPTPHLAVAERHACAIDATGALFCWGDPATGRLGLGATSGAWVAAPTRVTALPTTATAIATASRSSCAVASERLYCWGDLLDDATAHDAPVTKNDVPSVFAVAISPIVDHACVGTTGGAVWCWGNNGVGQLGEYAASPGGVAVHATNLDTGTRVVAVGLDFSCAIVGDGVRCWGSNTQGILGTTYAQRPFDDVPTSVLVGGSAHDAIGLVAGQAHVCALARDGKVWCWGSHTEKELGPNGDAAIAGGLATSSPTPLEVTGLNGRVTALAAGDQHTCALFDDGRVACWGANQRGQLGSPTAAPTSAAPLVVGGLTGAADLAAGGSRTCARTGTGDVVCWGAIVDASVDAGNGEPGDSISPVEIGQIPR